MTSENRAIIEEAVAKKSTSAVLTGKAVTGAVGLIGAAVSLVLIGIGICKHDMMQVFVFGFTALSGTASFIRAIKREK
ncbi:MAG: hypothetical protein IKD90_08860 [Clostridiales bacterium]|nr:hypothetical protein [Clostridiales bacterium]